MKIKAPFKIEDCGFMGRWLTSFRLNQPHLGKFRWMYCAPQLVRPQYLPFVAHKVTKRK